MDSPDEPDYQPNHDAVARRKSRLDLVMRSVLALIDNYDEGLITKPSMTIKLRQSLDQYFADEYDAGIDDYLTYNDDDDGEETVEWEPEDA